MDLRGSPTEIYLFKVMIRVRRVTISFVKAQFSHFRIPYNTLCLPPKFLHKPLFSNDPGSKKKKMHGIAILRGHLRPSEPREGLTACSAKEVTSYLSHFKTLSNGPAPGIEPATSRSAVKRSTD